MKILRDSGAHVSEGLKTDHPKERRDSEISPRREIRKTEKRTASLPKTMEVRSTDDASALQWGGAQGAVAERIPWTLVGLGGSLRGILRGEPSSTTESETCDTR